MAQGNAAVWFITGASRGLGRAIARAVLDHGHNVVATARRVEDVTAGLGAHERLLPLALDVTDEQQVKAVVEAAIARFARADVLVNNAGYGLLGAVEEVSAEDTRAVYDTNVFGLLAVTRAVLPIMRRQRSGRIINVSSMGGFHAFPGWGIYCSPKFAVEGLSEALAAEVASLGIHVTIIEPGAFRTDFLAGDSLRQAEASIADYASTVGNTRASARERNHAQPGDPAKAADAIYTVALPRSRRCVCSSAPTPSPRWKPSSQVSPATWSDGGRLRSRPRTLTPTRREFRSRVFPCSAKGDDGRRGSR